MQSSQSELQRTRVERRKREKGKGGKRRALCFPKMARPSKLVVTSVIASNELNRRTKNKAPPRVKSPVVSRGRA